MRVIRRLTLFSGAVLVLVSIWASAAAADTLRQNGAPVSTPYTLTMTTPNVTLAGALSQPITCATSQLTRTVTQNNVSGQRVKGNVDAWQFNGCTITSASGTASCSVVTTGTPWAGAFTLDATSSRPTDAMTFPVGTSLVTTCSLPSGAVTCSYVPTGNSAPRTLAGEWKSSTSATTTATTEYSNAPLAKVSGASACSPSAALSATYTTTVPNLTLTV